MRAAVAARARRHGRAAAIAYAAGADDSPWQSLACLLRASRHTSPRDLARARACLRKVRAAAASPRPPSRCSVSPQLALLAIDAVDWSEAETLVSRARSQVDRVGLADSPLATLVFAVSARVRAQRGRADEAQQDRRTTLSLLERLPEFAPWYTAEVRIVLAGAAVRRGDLVASRSLLGDAVTGDGRDPRGGGARELGRAVEAAAETLAESVARAGVADHRGAARSATAPDAPLVPRRWPAACTCRPTRSRRTRTRSIASSTPCSRSEAVERAREAGFLGDAPDELSDPLTRAA